MKVSTLPIRNAYGAKKPSIVKPPEIEMTRNVGETESGRIAINMDVSPKGLTSVPVKLGRRWCASASFRLTFTPRNRFKFNLLLRLRCFFDKVKLLLVGTGR